MSAAEANARLIVGRAGRRPRVGLVLGSGLGGLVDAVDERIDIPYADLDGFPVPGVSGHGGTLALGRLGRADVAMMTGRTHYYEHGRADAMRVPLESLKAAGVEIVILTNSAGSLRPDVGPGSVMMITDHINLAGANPLVGEASDARFVGMTQAYDAALRNSTRHAADERRIECFEGVYAWFSGPSFETPAEIRAARILGADAVGMSTVPEVILSRFLGLRVLAFSIVTNLAAGMSGAELSHQETKNVAPTGGRRLSALLGALLSEPLDA